MKLTSQGYMVFRALGRSDMNPGTRRYARWLLLLSTFALVGLFWLGSLILPFIPSADWAIRTAWAFLLLCLVVFLKAILPETKRWEQLLVWIRTILVTITGVFFLLLGLAAGASSLYVGPWALVFTAWFMAQGLAMMVWALLYFRAKSIPSKPP